jgi:hypothetical protein
MSLERGGMSRRVVIRNIDIALALQDGKEGGSEAALIDGSLVDAARSLQGSALQASLARCLDAPKRPVARALPATEKRVGYSLSGIASSCHRVYPRSMPSSAARVLPYAPPSSASA